MLRFLNDFLLGSQASKQVEQLHAAANALAQANQSGNGLDYQYALAQCKDALEA